MSAISFPNLNEFEKLGYNWKVDDNTITNQKETTIHLPSRVSSIASRSIGSAVISGVSTFAECVLRSKLVRMIGVGFAIALVLALIFSNPIGIIATVLLAIGGAIALVAASSTMNNRLFEDKSVWEAFKRFAEEMGWELGAIKRLFSDEPAVYPLNDAGTEKVILMSQPNHFKNSLAYMKEQGVKAVITIQEEGEMQNRLFMVPYTTEEYAQEGIAHIVMRVADHSEMTEEQLATIALVQQTFGTVAIHCKAGKGRSAMGAAAIVMNKRHKTSKQASDIISAGRNVNLYKGEKEISLRHYETWKNNRAKSKEIDKAWRAYKAEVEQLRSEGGDSDQAMLDAHHEYREAEKEINKKYQSIEDGIEKDWTTKKGAKKARQERRELIEREKHRRNYLEPKKDDLSRSSTFTSAY
jgi:protein-tyrosine phosphatase